MNKPVAQFDGPAQDQVDHSALASCNDQGADSASFILEEYYRCPPMLPEPFRTAETAATKPGFFRLGKDITCYGGLSRGQVAENAVDELQDVLQHLNWQGSGVQLPFNAAEVVENLRRERYAAHFREEGAALQ